MRARANAKPEKFASGYAIRPGGGSFHCREYARADIDLSCVGELADPFLTTTRFATSWEKREDPSTNSPV